MLDVGVSVLGVDCLHSLSESSRLACPVRCWRNHPSIINLRLGRIAMNHLSRPLDILRVRGQHRENKDGKTGKEMFHRPNDSWLGRVVCDVLMCASQFLRLCALTSWR